MCSRQDYVVTSDGRVMGYRGTFLKPGYDKDGYLQVSPCGKTSKLHRLVAEVYIPNPENKCCVNHKDGDKTNNNYTNLEWVTNKENTRHAYETGLLNNRGEKHHNAVLTCDEVKQIRQRRSSGETLVAISNHYGVNKSTVHDLVSGLTWKDCA